MTCLRSISWMRSRSFQGQIVSVWLSMDKQEVGLQLKGILVIYSLLQWTKAMFLRIHVWELFSEGNAEKCQDSISWYHLICFLPVGCTFVFLNQQIYMGPSKFKTILWCRLMLMAAAIGSVTNSVTNTEAA